MNQYWRNVLEGVCFLAAFFIVGFLLVLPFIGLKYFGAVGGYVGVGVMAVTMLLLAARGRG